MVHGYFLNDSSYFFFKIIRKMPFYESRLIGKRISVFEKKTYFMKQDFASMLILIKSTFLHLSAHFKHTPPLYLMVQSRFHVVDRGTLWEPHILNVGIF